MKMSNNFKNISKAFVGVLTLSAVLVACSKDTTEPIQLAGLNVINASAEATKYDFIVDNTKANEKDFQYNSQLGYLNLYPGLRRIGIVEKGKTAFLLSKQETFSPGVAYSVFIADTLSKRTFVKVEDDLTAPTGEKAKIRFVNLSPDAPALSLGINGAATDLFTGKAYKESTAFVEVEPGASINFEVKNAAKTVVATLPATKIEKGLIYTIWAKGFNGTVAADSLKMAAKIYTHK
ncbi:hypothetical protein PBAL39_11332 [Pedobacter sp. BAL39]|nr:hypothetical protein PBAL39_11332 [Pedobacter sp. BAL39]